jgi:hypothetical protein
LNVYNQNVVISFKNIPYAIYISLFNDFTTKVAYLFGHTGDSGNILAVRDSGNICLYKITQDYNSPSSKLTELSNDCVGGIKKSFVEEMQDFSGASFNPPAGKLYSYNLEYFAFKKMTDSPYPYILIQSRIDDLYQQKNQITYQEFLLKKTNRLNESDFVSFVSSFKPVKVSLKPKTKVSILATDNNNLKTVKNYYNLLANGDYHGAFSSLVNSNETEKDFALSQSKIFDQVIKEINQINNDTIEVFSDIQLHNQPPHKYREVFRINGSKLQRTIKESLNGDVSIQGNMRVFASERDNKSVLVLQKDSEERIIDTIIHDKPDIDWPNFYSPYFSPSGNYIVYTIGYYEGGTSNVYDLTRDKISEDIPEGKFNSEETLYFTCQFSEAYGPTEAKIYTVPQFSVKADLLKIHPELSKYWNYECSNDEKTNVINFEFSGSYENNTYSTTTKEVFRFNSRTGEAL